MVKSADPYMRRIREDYLCCFWASMLQHKKSVRVQDPGCRADWRIDSAALQPLLVYRASSNAQVLRAIAMGGGKMRDRNEE